MKVREASRNEWSEIALAVRDEWYEDLENDKKAKDFYERRFSHPWAEKNVKHFVLLDGGEVKSSLLVYEFPFILMNKKIRIGGIGEVITRKGQRRKGYADRLLRSVHNTMVEEGFDLALLYADSPEFYRKYDYHSLHTRELKASLSDVVETDKPEDMTFQDIEEDDRERIIELYNAESRNRLLFLLREEGYWDYLESKRNLTEEYLGCEYTGKVSVNDDGKICSYLVVRYHEGELRLMEYAFSAGHKDDIRYMLFREMEKARSKDIDLFLAAAPTRMENFCPSDDIEVKKREDFMVKGIGSSLTIGPDIGHDDYFLWDADSF